MEKRKILYFALILLLGSGCHDNISDTLNDAPINKDGSIAFRTDSVLTRGTPSDNLSAYNKVQLIAYSHTGSYNEGKSLYRQIELNKSNNTPPTWDYSPRMFWPEDRKLSFLAYAIEQSIPYVSSTEKEGVHILRNAPNEAPTIEYYVPQEVELQPDLLVTALLNHNQVSNVTLPMKHALSCVSFCATGPNNMRVQSIKLNKVYTKATLKLDDPSITWTLTPGSNNLTVLEPGIDSDIPLEENPTKGNYLMTANGYLMMIPQELKDATIEVSYLDKANKDKTITTTYTLPTTIVWAPGKKYIYKFGEEFEEVVVYYEKYADGSYGFQWNTQSTTAIFSEINDTKEIVEAGYGVLTKNRLLSSDKPTIQLGTATSVATKKIEAIGGGYNLYAISQTSIANSATFVLPGTYEPVPIYFDGNAVSCGKIIPHFAKGVSEFNPSEYIIRTPQQMRNISALTTPGPYDSTNKSGITCKQELNLDFSKPNIGGGTLNGAVVDETFSGTYEGASKSISNLTISTADNYIGLFSQSVGKLNDIILKSSSISGGSYVGGIAGYSYGAAVINRPRIIGVANNITQMVTIAGNTRVGAIAGENGGQIIGNTTKEEATDITVAEVSGWVTIRGSGEKVGGIVGHNSYGSIQSVLVNGVHVKGAGLGNLEPSQITIQGTNYVGGIAGQNDVTIDGNTMGSGTDIKNMPDLAGVVEIKGDNWIGGIAGINASTGTLNSVNVRSARSPGIKITANGQHVGGIVGQNSGQLGTGSDNTFISIRGNIEIAGNDYVGGIVGTNSSGAQLKNCFVYDFQTQSTPSNPNITYFAPKITSTVQCAGGIAGSNSASIERCVVFTVSGATLQISAPNSAGGISGYSEVANSKVSTCSFIGNVQVSATNNSGGILGSNNIGTTIEKCWVGNSDGNGVIKDAIDNLGLIITLPPGNPPYGIPYITGNNNIGGIVGLNSGTITNITLSDNVKIGRLYLPDDVLNGSNFVGGIVGGNAPSGKVTSCTVANASGKEIIIQGSRSLGGVAGLNNGIVESCNLTAPADKRLTINGLGTIGGIIGQNGGHFDITIGDNVGTGGDNTRVKNCNVTGYVTIQGHNTTYGTATEVGGIIGLNGPAKDKAINVENCVVKGAADANSILISVAKNAGGIVGTNSGNVSQCDVQNATIKSNSSYAGGIAGQSSSTAASYLPKEGYRSNLNDCRVYAGTAITGTNSGALIGYIDAETAITFGDIQVNQVNNSGVTVNGTQAGQNYLIVGFSSTADGGTVTLNHTVTAVPSRP